MQQMVVKHVLQTQICSCLGPLATRSLSVRNHSEFSATMQDAVDMVATYTPKVVVSEQVEGFDKPYEAGGTFTPNKESFSFQLRFQLSTFLISGFGFVRFSLENLGTRDKR